MADPITVIREALTALDELVPPHLRSSRHGENYMGSRYETIRAALAALPEVEGQARDKPADPARALAWTEDGAAGLRVGGSSMSTEEERPMNNWTRTKPTRPGIFDHRNLENAKGRVPIPARVMFVGYVNWIEDRKLGHGTTPTPYMPARLRACSIEQPMTADSLTVEEWGGEWRAKEGGSHV